MSYVDSYIRMENITKTFGGFKAVDNISLDIPVGNFTTLLGPSGCGKTTLMRLIAGFYECDEGSIYIENKKVNGLPPYKRNTPLVFQEYALFPHMTVYENIAYGLKLHKTREDEIDKRVREMLQMFNLVDMDGRYPKQLSGGQQQRVAFARALIMGQRVLLLDEPLSNLDAKLRVDVRTELRDLQQRLGITTVYVTHDQDEALSMSDIIAVLERGRISQVGTPWEIYFRPINKFVANFVGTVNFMDVEVVNEENGEIIVKYLDKLIRLNNNNYAVEKGEKVTLVIRPESISLIEEDQDIGMNVLEGEIKNRSFLGHMIRYWIQVGDVQLLFDDSNPAYLGHISGKVRVSIDKSKVHLIKKEVENENFSMNKREASLI